MPDHRASFRPDIEGLRGIAILLVVLFHAGVPLLAGGFVGVDVFFVLSGFFITGPLVREIIGTGRIDFADFYGRRAQRLMPVLLVVLLATLAMVTLLYAPIDRAAIAGTARAVAFSAGNIVFAREDVNYFSSGASPLLHTWSLGVEQQFYLVWPLLLLLFAFAAARWQARAADATDAASHDARLAQAKGLLLGMTVAGAISFAVSLWLTSVSQPWAFFGLPARIWEFALGGVVSMMTTGTPTDAKWRPRARTVWMQRAGLASIAAAVLLYDRAVPYPGIAALLPAIGAALMLAGGAAASQTPVGRALSASPLQWLGRLSYAWYLWHWPLIGLGAVLDGDIGIPGRLLWAGAGLVLAWLTYRFAEQPAREGGLLGVSAYWLPTAAVAATAFIVMLAQVAMHNGERQASSPAQRAFAAAREDRRQHGCWATTVDESPTQCEFGDTRSATTVVLLGDSHAEHWIGALDRAGREHGWKVVLMVKGGCPVSDMRGLLSRSIARHYQQCDRYREAMLQRIIAMRPSAVILSSWDHYIPARGGASGWQTTPDIWQRGLRRTYSRLASAGIRTVAIRGTPRTPFDVPTCLSRRDARLPFAEECTFERERSLSRAARDAQSAAARGLPIRFVDMNDRICAASRCDVMQDGIIKFADDNHLTASFSTTMAPVLGARLAAAFGRFPERREQQLRERLDQRHDNRRAQAVELRASAR
jgi:peptidoglycan/LPS O-acetylase OafA/YrhL